MTTTKKTCFKCKSTLPITEFYKHSQMGDGHLNKCKLCTRLDAIKNRAANRDYYVEYDKNRSKLEHRKDNAKKQIIKWKDAYPERRKAQNLIAREIKKGTIKKMHCFTCGAEKTEAHHPDYSRPFDVVWLCSHHHKLAHAMIIEYKRAS